jgi:hypothetical protein
MIIRSNNYKVADSGPVDIEATLSRKSYQLLRSGSATLQIPEGVTMYNRSGSRLLNFSCDDRDLAEILCDGLDVSGIPWNEGA